MLSTYLKAKLHMGAVTQAELWYDGSCADNNAPGCGFHERDFLD